MPSPEGRAELHAPPGEAARPLAWRLNAALFLATVASCFYTWSEAGRWSHAAVRGAIEYTVSLLAILLAHEFGHYVAARIHNVDASLPYFLPLPHLSPFGTMGAVIRMRSVIPTRRALLDIGAAGPLAGLTLAIPIYAWGVAHSPLVDTSSGSVGMELGGSLLIRLLDHVFAGPVPDGMDILLSPMAFAGWAGMFVTMLNLLPAGQLDGGHVAFALFGPRQNRIAQWVHRSILAFFLVSLGSFVARDLRAGFGLWRLGKHVNSSLLWFVWFEALAVLGSMASRGGPDRIGVRTRIFATLGIALLAGALHDVSSVLPWLAWFAGLSVLVVMEARWGALRSESTVVDHPPTGPEPLGNGRAMIAILALVFFVALFMPVPFSM